MPHTTCTIRRWEHQLFVTDDEDGDDAMRRADRSEIDTIRQHLLGDLAQTARRSSHHPQIAGRPGR